MNDDLISRQVAIDALERKKDKNAKGDIGGFYNKIIQNDIDALMQLPSAQPERLTDDDFETIRIHLNAYKEQLCNQRRWEEAEEYQRIIDRFMAFASAQPETNCSEIPNNSDTISREAAIDAADEIIKRDTSGNNDVVNALKAWSVYIKALPSIKPEQRTGHWVEERTYIICPNCHDIWHYEANQTERFKFCPTCGAKMQ